MKRILSTLLILSMAFGGSLLPIGEAYAALQPVMIGHSDGLSVLQNANGTRTLTWHGGGDNESAADPAQFEEWADQGESWSNSGAVAQTQLRKTYRKNESLVTVRKNGTSISFAPIQIEEPAHLPQEEVAEGRQINERQSVSNVLRIGPSVKSRPASIQGKLRSGGRPSRNADGASNAAPAVYEGLFDEHTDLHLVALSGGVKEDIVVRKYTGNHIYAYQVTVLGMSLRQDGQRVELVQDGEVIGEIEAPYMIDANGAYSEDITVTLSSDGILTYIPSDAWMANAAYPVVIDPTLKYYEITEGYAAGWTEDTFVSSAAPNTNFDLHDGGALYVSNVATAYTRPKFPDGSQPAPAGAIIPRANDILVQSASIDLSVRSGSGDGQFSVRRVLDFWGNYTLTYANGPGYTEKTFYKGTLPTSGRVILDLTELFSEWFNALDQKKGAGLAIVSEDGASRILNGGSGAIPNRPRYNMTYIENPDAPVVTATPHGGGINSGTGYVTLSWAPVWGASRYYVGIFNGRDYEYFLLPLGQTSFSTQNMKIWPTPAEIAAGRYQLHHDGLGTELPMSPAFTYSNVPGGTYGDNVNYFFKVIPANQYGQAPEPSQPRFAVSAVTLPDTVPPNQPTDVAVFPSTYTNAATITVSWNGVIDMIPTGTSTSLGTGNIQYSIDNTTNWQNTGINTASGSYTFSTIGLSDGQHTIYIRGMDSAGNFGGFLGCYFYVDQTPPTAPVVAIDPAAWTKANTASLTWSGIEDLDANLPLARVEYRFGTGNWINTGHTDQSYSGLSLDISQLNGEYEVAVRGVDRAGNDGKVGAVTVYVDRTAPTLVSAGITPDWWTALDEVEFAWEGAADAHSGLDALAYAINDESEVPLPVSADGTETIDISHLADGQHTLHFLLADVVGNKYNTEIPVYVDRTDPDIALLAPIDGDWITGITEIWGSIDDLSIKEWRLTVAGEDGIEQPISSGTDNRTPQILGRLNTGLFADGERVRLALYAEDHAGNSSTVTGVYLIVDKSVKPITGNIMITAPTTGQTMTTAKAEGAYDIRYTGAEDKTLIYVDGMYVHDVRAGQLFDLYPILYLENSLHSVAAVSLDTSGSVHFSQGLGANILLSDAFADDSLLAEYNGVGFSPTGDGALGAGSLTSTVATSARPMLAFRLRVAGDAGITYEYRVEGGGWLPVVPEKYVVFKTPVYSLQTRAQLPNGAVLHGWEIEGVIELNPVRFITKLEKKAEALRIAESHVYRAQPPLTISPALPFTNQNQFIGGERIKDDFILDALRAPEGEPLSVTLFGEDTAGTLYAAEQGTSAILLREVLSASQREEVRTLTGADDLYALRLLPWSEGTEPMYAYSVDSGTTWETLLPDRYTVLSKASKEVQVRATMPVGGELKAWHIEGVAATPKDITVRTLQAPQNVIAADYGAYPPEQRRTVISWTDPNTADLTLGNGNVTIVLKNGIYMGETKDTRFTDTAYNPTATYSAFFVRIYGQPSGSGPYFLTRESAVGEAKVTRMTPPEQVLGASDFQLEEFEQSEYLNMLYGGNYTFSLDPTPPPEEARFDQALLGKFRYCSLGFEPVNFNTGNFFLIAQDVHQTDLGGAALNVLRTFNTQSSETDGPFGSRWASEFGQHLTLYQDGSLAYRRTDGAQVIFEKNADGSYTGDDIDFLTITMDAEAGEYRIEELDGTAYVFTLFGLLKRIEQPGGQAVTVERDGLGLITGIVAPSGARLDVTMDEAGHITLITTPGGESTQYMYKGKNLVSVIDVRGNVTRYVYDEEDRMIEWYDAAGARQVYNEYDELNRVVYQEDARDGKYKLEYFSDHTITTDAEGNQVAIYFNEKKHTVRIVDANGAEFLTAYGENGAVSATTDERGQLTSYEYDERGNMVKRINANGTIIRWGYDQANNLTLLTDQIGNETTYEYDERSNLIMQTNPDGGALAYAYDAYDNLISFTDPLGHVTAYTYDGRGNLLTQADPLGNVTSYTYDTNGRRDSMTDALGHVTRYEYDAKGNITVLTFADGTKATYTYDAMNRPTSMTDPLGNVTKYKYDPLGNLVETTLPDGSKQTAKYTLNNQLAEVTDALGATTAFTYDGNGNLLTETDALGAVTAFQYDEANWPVIMTLPTGAQETYTYDPATRLLVSSTDVNGLTNAFVYDAAGNLLTRTLPGGATLQNEYDEMDRLVRQVNPLGGATEMAYDLRGNITSITDPLGAKTQFEYDALGRLTKTIDALGNETVTAYDALGRIASITDALGGKTTYVYDETGNLVMVIDALGAVSAFQYDEAGNLTGMTDPLGHTANLAYNKLGQATRLTQKNGGVVSSQFDKAGRLVKEIDPLGAATSYRYDALGRVTQVTDALEQKALFEYDALGNIIGITAPGGGQTLYAYDAGGRLLSTTDEMGLETHFAYDERGQIVSTEANGNATALAYDAMGNITSVTDAEDRTVEFAYDLAGRMISTIYPDGSEDRTTYDVLGRVVKVEPRSGVSTEYEYDALGRVTASRSGDRVARFSYDALGRLILQTLPDGSEQAYAYDALGNLVSHTDPLGNATQYAYNAESWLEKITYANEATESLAYDLAGRVTSATDAEGAKTAYRYDKVGRLTQVTDALGNKTGYRYSALDQVAQVRNALGRLTKYEYDARGNLTAETDALGNTTAYTYTPEGWLESIIKPNGAVISHAYDRTGQLLTRSASDDERISHGYNEIGKLTVSETDEGVTAYQYDDHGQLVSVTHPDGSTLGYTYDALGRKASLTYPDGKTVYYEYDAMDRLVKVTGLEGEVTAYAYDARGQRIQTEGDGLITTYAYDVMGNLTQQNTSGKTALELAYTYTPGGRIASEVRTEDNEAILSEYTYDPLGQLRRFGRSDGYEERYAYDAVGNMKQKALVQGNTTTRINMTHNAANQMTGMSSPNGRIRYGYDANGNMTSKTMGKLQDTYTYDAMDRLTGYTGYDGFEQLYTLDSFGLRTGMQQRGDTNRLTLEEMLQGKKLDEDAAAG